MNRRSLFSMLFGAPVAAAGVGMAEKDVPVKSPNAPKNWYNRMRIVSDGSPGGTRIYDKKGVDISRSFKSMKIECDGSELVKVQLGVVLPELDIQVDEEQVQVVRHDVVKRFKEGELLTSSKLNYEFDALYREIKTR